MMSGGPGVRLRSLVAGRQRWDVGALLDRPDLAQTLEAALLERPGVTGVRANPLTGRLLVLHDLTLNPDDVVVIVRQAAAVAGPTDAVVVTPRSKEERDASPETRRRGSTGPGSLLGLGAAAVAIVVSGPIVRLGVVLAATAIIVRRAWRRSSRLQEASASSASSPRRPIRQIVGSHRRQFYLASCLSGAAQMLELAPAVFLGWMALVLLKGSSGVLLRLGLVGASTQLLFLAGATALVSGVNAAVTFAANSKWHDLARQVRQEWRGEIYARVQKAELRYLEGERMSRLARILTEDIDQLGGFFDGSADYFVRTATSVAILIPVFLVLAPSIAWVAFLPAPIIMWLSFSYRERAAPNYASSSESASLLQSQVINNLQASATIKSFGAEDYEIGRIRNLSEGYTDCNRRVDTGTEAYTQTVRLTALWSLAGTLLLGSLEVIAGTLQFEVFLPLAGLPQMVHFQLPRLGEAVDEYHRTVGALGRVSELLTIPVESGGTGRHLDAAFVEGEMVLESVTFAYPGRPPVLNGVSLNIASKKTTGIVGVTGAGKTTIAKLLLRFQDVTSGRVLLDGIDVRDLRLDDLRKTIAFVAQDAFLFDGNVGDNIAYGSFYATRDQVERAARVAEADVFIKAMPEGYNTMIGERGVTLSGGQKQRLALARAILKGAPILILDEATSAVDNETEAAIQHALREFARDRTLVVIAHRLSTIRHADWIYVMEEGGTIVEQGTHEDMMVLDGLYASLWRLQIGEPANDN
jgi:ATP-binding cassette subfamily B protein